MSPSYTVCPIPADKIDQALPVAQLAFPGLELAEWRQNCRPSVDWTRHAEVWAAIAPAGHVRGICRVLEDDAGATLRVDGLVIATVVHPGAVADAMLRRLVSLSTERRCSRLEIAVPAPFPEIQRAIAQARDQAFLPGSAPLSIVVLAE